MKARERFEMLKSLQALGFTYDEAQKLRRISMTLQRWHELECGTGDARVTRSVEREGGDDNGKPFLRVQYMGIDGKWVDRRFPCADRERGAKKRLAAILAPKKGILEAYIQGDPRGCALYLVRKEDLNGLPIDQAYNRGVAVY